MARKKKYNTMESRPKALLVAEWLRDKKGQDVEVIDVAGICPIAETIVLVTATSQRHAKGLASHVLDRTAEENLEYLGMEGQREGEWILVDLNDVLVHVFTGDRRDLLDLEGLWSEGERLKLPRNKKADAADDD